MSRWFRVYEDMVDDPKVQRLPADLFRALVNLWCLASANGGVLPALGDVAFKLRLSEAKARELLNGLADVKLLDKVGEASFQPHNWNGRQYNSDSSTERVKRFRKRRQGVSSDVSGTPPEAETDTETDLAAQQTVSEFEKVRASLAEAFGEDESPDGDMSPILALIDKGYDLDKDILPVIRARAPKAQSVGSWRYFVPAIEQAKAANGVIKPKAVGTPSEPVAWLPADSPRWGEMNKRSMAEKRRPLLAMGSMEASGVGAFVPKAWLLVEMPAA